MRHPIIVPHDGSTASAWALPVVVAFARVSGASLHLVQVREGGVPADASIADEAATVLPAPYYGEPPAVTAARDAAAHEAAMHALDRVASLASRRYGVRVSGDVIEAADVVQAVLDEATRRGAPLIVMVTHGRPAVARALLGSVADAVTRASHVPVVLVPSRVALSAGGAVGDVVDVGSSVREEAVAAFALRHILVALDGSPAGEPIVDGVAAVLRGAHVEVSLFSVVQPMLASGVSAPDALRDVGVAAAERNARTASLAPYAGRLRGEGHTVRTRVVEGTDPCREILAAASEESADLIAMATHGRHGLPRVARGSVTDGVVRATRVPVLLLHPAGWSVPAGVPSPEP